jgi:hypothetical protein
MDLATLMSTPGERLHPFKALDQGGIQGLWQRIFYPDGKEPQDLLVGFTSRRREHLKGDRIFRQAENAEQFFAQGGIPR